MAAKQSKKQVILHFFAGRNTPKVEIWDLHAACDEVRRQLGPDASSSLGYIARILRDAGFEVHFEDRYSDPVLPEPYASRLKGALEFHDLASTESSLLRLDAMHREYSAAGDRTGTKAVYGLVKKGKMRAQRFAADPRVRETKRKEKEEIARWFQVWLETPDLFTDWLDIRKSSPEFGALFGKPTEE